MPDILIVLEGGLVNAVYTENGKEKVRIIDIDKDSDEPIHIHTRDAIKANLEKTEIGLKKEHT